MNRLLSRSGPGGYQIGFGYSTTGQRATMTDSSGTTSYTYDVRDRVLQKIINFKTGVAMSLDYLYDANGNLTNLWTGTINGVTNVYQYDALNRLTNVLANGTNAAAYRFDGVGNLQSGVFGNGVTNLYQYDSLNRLTNAVWNLSGSSNLASFGYQLGRTGNRTNLVENIGTTVKTYRWQYDPLDRMTNEHIGGFGNTSYGLDAVGNRLIRTNGSFSPQSFSYTTNDWLTNDVYDANGNTTLSAGTNCQYDAENHLTNCNGVFITYNGDGLRMLKTVGGTNTYYLVDDRNPTGYPQVVEEWSGSGYSGALTRAYNYGLSPVSQRDATSGAVHYYGMDGHGSVRFLTDTNGTITDSYVYDAFGNMVSSNISTVNAYLYCGEQFDSDLGMYYLRARYYQPVTGRFWTMDTYQGNTLDPLSLHKYLYCQANPINGSDPSGNDDLGSVMAATETLSFGDSFQSFNRSIQDVLGSESEFLYIRSFAPWATFGGGFAGDNRSFTTAHVPDGKPISPLGDTSRIAAIVKFNTSPLRVVSAVAYSDPSHHPVLGTATGTPTISVSFSGNTLHVNLSGHLPLLPGSPDIDDKLDMSVQPGAGQTQYSGQLYGDAFPDAEVFVVNQSSDLAKMLLTFGTKGGQIAGPFQYLPGNNNRPMGSFSKGVNN